MNHSTNTPIAATAEMEHFDVIVIGTGFSGLAVGTALARQGRHSFVLLERASSVGGTWRENTYPGAACDIQSHLYSYSFRQNPSWSRVYATQPEILEYLESTASDEGLLARIRFNTDVTAARWYEEKGRWEVDSTTGTRTANVLVTASGHLSDPKMPSIEGAESFKGEIFHSARWDHAVELTGKRVGVIGTGASAIQIVPEIAKTAAQVTVFQRSAPYIVPREDHVYDVAEKRMFARIPEVAQELRDDLFWGNESRFPQRLGIPDFIDTVARKALSHLRNQVSDERLRAKLTPDYQIGCKRILISNDYYPAVSQEHVNVETAAIGSLHSSGVELVNSESIDLDVIVVATGFEATDLPISHRIYGRSSQLLADHWAEGRGAFDCSTVNGFPNLFVMLGPNTGLGAGSIIHMVESQMQYISSGIDYILDNDVAIEPEPEREERFLEDLEKRALKTVWVNGGCQSWYLHPISGKLSALWPDFMHRFRRENGVFNQSNYVTSDVFEQPHPDAFAAVSS